MKSLPGNFPRGLREEGDCEGLSAARTRLLRDTEQLLRFRGYLKQQLLKTCCRSIFFQQVDDGGQVSIQLMFTVQKEITAE